MWMLTAMLGLALAPQVAASDGETPAEESVCDSLEGGEAWGLCNAYCEAMDCDSDDPMASDQACEHVLENFLANDPGPIPCERPRCPCYDEADLDALVAECSSLAEGELQCADDADIGIVLLECKLPGSDFFAVTNSAIAACALRDFRDLDPNILIFDLTPDEAQACIELGQAKQGEGVCDVGP